MSEDAAQSTLLESHQGGVLTLTLNRPKVFNSFNREMASALQAALDRAEADESVRCIVLTGEGRAFCAGQDLGEITAPDGPDMTTIVRESYNATVRRLRAIEKPIIGAVNGVAAGAGANLALNCDLCVANEKASFIQAFSKIGLIPDSGGTYLMPRLVGMQRATGLAFLGEKISAEDAERMGMIWRAYPEDVFEAKVRELAEKLASMPTKGLGLTKRAFNQGLTQGLDAQLDVEETLQFEASQTHDYKEGVTAFLEKRPAVFKGH
jgi:2-(1,2-epoxy-1,2-dihydrophenyl)acetyl-CoA isomerase